MLANVVRKPMTQIFKEFTGKPTYAEQKSAYGTGDVKYHLGTSYDRPTATGAPPATPKSHLFLQHCPAFASCVFVL